MKLHLGCGKRYIPGFEHIDALPQQHLACVHDIRRLPMVADDTAELIYACHVLEHFWPIEAVDVLTEWRRILKPGGTLRLSVPDFTALISVYRQTGQLADIIGPLFGRGSYLYNVHHTVFDEATLRQTLNLSRFTDVRHYDWRQTEHADIDDYSQAYWPHMDKEHGIQISLNMEATKP